MSVWHCFIIIIIIIITYFDIRVDDRNVNCARCDYLVRTVYQQTASLGWFPLPATLMTSAISRWLLPVKSVSLLHWTLSQKLSITSTSSSTTLLPLVYKQRRFINMHIRVIFKTNTNITLNYGARERTCKRFLRASAMLKHVIDIGWTSVTRWYCIKTAEHIVMLSSPHDSPFILVLCISRSSRNSDGVTPCGGAKYRWGIKICSIFLPITRYISQTIQDIAMVAVEGE